MGRTLDLYILDIEEYKPLGDNEIENIHLEYSYDVIRANKLEGIVHDLDVLEIFLTKEEIKFILPQYFDEIYKLEDYKHYDPVKFKDIMIKILKYLKKNDLETYNELKEDMVNLIKLTNKAIKLNKPLGWEWNN